VIECAEFFRIWFCEESNCSVYIRETSFNGGVGNIHMIIAWQLRAEPEGCLPQSGEGGWELWASWWTDVVPFSVKQVMSSFVLK
jgi:hypothetical protein